MPLPEPSQTHSQHYVCHGCQPIRARAARANAHTPNNCDGILWRLGSDGGWYLVSEELDESHMSLPEHADSVIGILLN